MTFYRQHHLTVAEILEIFNYADQNRDGQISTEEWDEFHRIFISEFEANDADKDYKLSHDELKKLLRSSESLNKIAYRTQISRTFAGMKDHEKEQDFKKSMEDDEKNEGKKDGKKEAKKEGNDMEDKKDPVANIEDAYQRFYQRLTGYVMIALDTQSDGSLNFREYLTFRKTLVAWYTCAQEIMTRPAFFCALKIINPYKALERNDSDIIYKIALKLGSDDFISYPQFVRVVDSYVSFGRFDGVQDDGTVSKDEMIKELENAA
jgi:hypothetical protein